MGDSAVLVSNDNADFISSQEKFKFIDDIIILEKINLLYIGLASYNYKSNVASDIIENGYFLPPENLNTQANLKKNIWMDPKQQNVAEYIQKQDNELQLHQRLSVDNKVLENITETKLLGVMINNTLTWDSNTKYITK